jgi:6-phosphogluconate dehydrogenase
MQIGFIGLGRMGSNMVRRLLHQGQECVGHASRVGIASPFNV